MSLLSLLPRAAPRTLVVLAVCAGGSGLLTASPARAQVIAGGGAAGAVGDAGSVSTARASAAVPGEVAVNAAAVSAGEASRGEATAAAAGTRTPVAAGGEGMVAGAGTAVRAVAARDLERGEVLTAADIRYVAVPQGDAAAEAPATLVGWRTRSVIDEGEPLREPNVSPPDLVRAGETVQAVYRGKSIVLRVTGTAAGSGALGERVLVRVDARRRLEGVVIGPSLVELDSNESR